MYWRRICSLSKRCEAHSQHSHIRTLFAHEYVCVAEADAKKALEKIQGKQIMDRRLKVSFAKHRKRKHALLDEDEPGDDTNAKVKTDVATATAAVAGPPQIVVPRKHSRGRLIVRNLSFKAKEEDLRKAFGPYGKLKEGEMDGGGVGFQVSITEEE